MGRYFWNGSKKGLQESSSWQLLNHWAWSTSDVHVDALRPRKSESKPLDKRAALEANMRARGFKIVDVPGDNNCQFHAVADQLEQVMIDSRKVHEMKFFERSFA